VLGFVKREGDREKKGLQLGFARIKEKD